MLFLYLNLNPIVKRKLINTTKMKKITFILLGMLLIMACSDDNEPNPQDNPDSQDQMDPDPDGNDPEIPTIAENVVVISDDTSNVVSTDTDLENGIYIIEYSGDVAAVEVGDIIVGDEDEGFLRSVTSISVDGTTQTMETEQATFEDVFENADISFNLDLIDLQEITNQRFPIISNEVIIDYMAEGVSVNNANGFSFDMNRTQIASGNLSFEVTGNATFNPNFNFDAEIRAFQIRRVVFEADNANLSLSAGYELNASGSISTTDEVRLVSLSKRFTFLVGSVPVVVTAVVELDASLNTTLDAAFVASGDYTKTYTVDTGVTFENGQWSNRFNTGESTSINPLEYNGTVNLTEILAITPNVQLRFYGVVAPFIEPEMFAEYKFNTSFTSGDWDSAFDVGLNLTTGVNAEIFGRTIFDFDQTNTFRVNLWNAPSFLEIVSGNMQEGEEEALLEEPVRVRVTDNLGNPISLAQVNVELVDANGNPSTSGSIDLEKIETDDEGIAEFMWTLGELDDEEGATRFAEVKLMNSEGEEISQGANPIRFQAEINDESECGGLVDLSLFTATECGEVIEINDVLVSAVETTAEDCAPGACFFESFNGGIGVAPARILFDITAFIDSDSNAEEIVIRYEDHCGVGCTKAFVYDENNMVIASLENTVVNEEAEFRFEGRDLLLPARFIAFSSCEGQLICFDATFF